MPTVLISNDMSPELAVDVSIALQAMGVAVKVNGSTLPLRQPKIIAVISPKGGSGKTAVASNLAVALAQRCPGRVVAVDLDLQFGDLATALSLTPEYTLAQLARTAQIDATTVKLFLTPHESGLFVLASAQRSGRRRLDQRRPHLVGVAAARAELRLRASSTRRRVSTNARWPPSSAPPICCWCRAST